jgi:hypothetical protein
MNDRWGVLEYFCGFYNNFRSEQSSKFVITECEPSPQRSSNPSSTQVLSFYFCTIIILLLVQF